MDDPSGGSRFASKEKGQAPHGARLLLHNCPRRGKAVCERCFRILEFDALLESSEEFLDRRGLQFLECLGLNLTDALACDGQALTDLL